MNPVKSMLFVLAAFAASFFFVPDQASAAPAQPVAAAVASAPDSAPAPAPARPTSPARLSARDPLIMTRSESLALSDEEREAFRRKGGTVTEDPGYEGEPEPPVAPPA